MISKFDGRYSFLSNFYPCLIEHQGISYKSVEAYYVAMKIKDDQIVNGVFMPWIDIREYIATITNPGTVKRLGRKLKIRKDWDVIKLSVMEYGIVQKFKDEKLKEMLLLTKNEELVEGNFWHDNFYGQCSCEKCGVGQNHLGKILMRIRNG